MKYCLQVRERDDVQAPPHSLECRPLEVVDEKPCGSHDYDYVDQREIGGFHKDQPSTHFDLPHLRFSLRKILGLSLLWSGKPGTDTSFH